MGGGEWVFLSSLWTFLISKCMVHSPSFKKKKKVFFTTHIALCCLPPLFCYHLALFIWGTEEENHILPGVFNNNQNPLTEIWRKLRDCVFVVNVHGKGKKQKRDGKRQIMKYRYHKKKKGKKKKKKHEAILCGEKFVTETTQIKTFFF